MRVVKSSAVYAALVFAAGFLLGVIRVLFVAPILGTRSTLLDAWIPQPDLRKRHYIEIHAPAPLVMKLARGLDPLTIPIVSAIFHLRSRILGDSAPIMRWSRGLVEEARAMGWGCLTEDPERFVIMGAFCQPWQANVRFWPVPAAEFAAFRAPDRVKIAWTLEAEPLGPALTRFSTETRAVATDANAQARFRRYWRVFGIGAMLIRLVLLRAVRQQAERAWRNQSSQTPMTACEHVERIPRRR